MVQKSFLCLMYNYFNNSQDITCMYVSVCDNEYVCLCAASVVVYVWQLFSVSLYRLKMFYHKE